MCYLPSTIHNFEPTALQKSSSVPVKMKGCEDVWFKKRAIIESLAAEKILPIDIHCSMQAVC
jgi:hypothetical protein